MPTPNPPLYRDRQAAQGPEFNALRDRMTADIGRNFPPAAPDPTWIAHIQSILQGLGQQQRGGLDIADVIGKVGPESSNVGMISPGDPVAAHARQIVDAFKTDRMTQFDPMAAQRQQQAAQIVSALSNQGNNPKAPGVHDMQKRARLEGLLGGMQGYDPQRDDPALIQDNFRQLMFGRYQ